MSLPGWGAGDIIALSKLAIQVHTCYKDAPQTYRHITEEVKSLEIIINKAVQHFESTSLSMNARQEGQEILKSCASVLLDLNALILKYNSLASANKRHQVFKKIKLGAEDITTLRARLTSNTCLLNAFIQSCEMHKMCEMQEQMADVLNLRRTTSRISITSFAASINTKKTYKEFCKSLHQFGVTAEILSQKKREIFNIFKDRNGATSFQIGDSAIEIEDQSEFPVKDESEETARHMAVSGGYSDAVVSATVAETSDAVRMVTRLVEAKDKDTEIPLHFAVRTAHADMVEQILMEGTSIEVTNEYDNTPLHLAARNGRADMVELLLRKGASVHARTVRNNSPLHLAAMNAASSGHVSVVELLLGKDAPIEQGEHNRTPLHFAAIEGHTSVVELLLGRGALIEAVDEENNTPLHLAVLNGHGSVVELLLERGALIEARGKCNRTPLHHAAQSGHPGLVELLLGRGVLVEAMSEENDTPLHLAAFFGHSSVVGLLLDRGAFIEAKGERNRTPLHFAVFNGHFSVVELLLERGALIEALDERNDTPLHCAAYSGHASVVELLLQKGACVEARDIYDTTPMDLAVQSGHTGIVQLLINKQHVI